jgi:hypothetical protein
LGQERLLDLGIIGAGGGAFWRFRGLYNRAQLGRSRRGLHGARAAAGGGATGQQDGSQGDGPGLSCP